MIAPIKKFSSSTTGKTATLYRSTRSTTSSLVVSANTLCSIGRMICFKGISGEAIIKLLSVTKPCNSPLKSKTKTSRVKSMPGLLRMQVATSLTVVSIKKAKNSLVMSRPAVFLPCFCKSRIFKAFLTSIKSKILRYLRSGISSRTQIASSGGICSIRAQISPSDRLRKIAHREAESVLIIKAILEAILSRFL
ncbi:Uncharacterised protein [Chlamydia trachomatis]|nr:Uncharacterised protein [Chlamydia trachomatis]CRH85905.1 Uncharacterised protein [Chlamydia trachomatis]